MLRSNKIINQFPTVAIGGLKRMVMRLDIDKTDEPVREFLKALKVDKDQYIFESEGKPIGALVSLDILDCWTEREKRFSVYDRIWEKNKKVSAREVRKDVAEALKEIRQ